MWLLVGQHVGWQTVGRQTVSKFSCDGHSQVTASCSRGCQATVTLPLQHNPLYSLISPAIPISQICAVCGVMKFDNVSPFVQFNMEYGSRKEGGACSLVIVIIIGTALHGRNTDEWPLFIGNVT